MLILFNENISFSPRAPLRFPKSGGQHRFKGMRFQRSRQAAYAAYMFKLCYLRRRHQKGCNGRASPPRRIVVHHLPTLAPNTAVATALVNTSPTLPMLLLLHEQDKMAPDWSHPEVSFYIRLSSEVILARILVYEDVTAPG